MDGNIDYRELIKKALDGDEASMNRLSAAAGESLRRYVFRITLDEALTHDIVQEVMLEMFKVLGKLKCAERFHAWLHAIALNKLRRHYGNRWEGKVVGGLDEKFADASAEGQEGLANLVNEELKQIIFAAMNGLAPRHRAVLTMRCYDEMSYGAIAETMGMSELGVRGLFYRAKKALAKQLSRRGLGKGSLLTALVLFGKMTAVSEAAAAEVSVTAATVKVGLAGGIAGAATGKAVATVAAAGVIAAGVTVAIVPGEPGGGKAGVEEAEGPVAALPVEVGQKDRSELWYYYPDGAAGAVMTRSVLVDGDGGEQYCQWLQNDVGNYYYDERANTVTLENYRAWECDYSVRRLPTDGPELSDFLSSVEGKGAMEGYIGSRGKDLLVVRRMDSENGFSASWTTQHGNVLEEDYFKCDWPRGAELIDKRDAMHKRGWTYFRVEGELAGETVDGVGRFPFVYGAVGRCREWLRLRVGDFEIAGDTRGFCVTDAEGKVVARYAGGAEGGIFAGLSRPWEGLHTIDTVRRDAARRGMRFETRAEGKRATVVVDCGEVKLEYAIDMLTDVVEEIKFVSADGREGDLRFIYGEEVGIIKGGIGGRDAGNGRGAEESEGLLWLAKMAKGEFGIEE